MTCTLLDSAAVSDRTLPECIKRRREVEAGDCNCSRMRCLSVRIEVLSGESIRTVTSGFDVENRTTTSRGRSVAAMIACNVGGCFSRATSVSYHMLPNLIFMSSSSSNPFAGSCRSSNAALCRLWSLSRKVRIGRGSSNSSSANLRLLTPASCPRI